MRTRALALAFVAALSFLGAAAGAPKAKPKHKAKAPPPAPGAPNISKDENQGVLKGVKSYRSLACYFGPALRGCPVVSPDAPAWLNDDLPAMQGRFCFDGVFSESEVWAHALSDVGTEFLNYAAISFPPEFGGRAADPRALLDQLKKVRDVYARTLDSMSEWGFAGSLEGRGGVMLGELQFVREKMDEALAAIEAKDGRRLKYALLAMADRSESMRQLLAAAPPEGSRELATRCEGLDETLARVTGQPATPASVTSLWRLGLNHSSSGRPGRALKAYEAAIAQAETLGNLDSEQSLHLNAAMAALSAGDPETGVSHMDAALMIPRSRNDLFTEYSFLGRFALALTAVKARSDLVQRYGERADRIRERVQLADESIKRGDRFFSDGRFAEAEKQYLQSTEIGNPLAYLRAGDCEVRLGNPDQATAYYEKVLVLAKAQERRDWQAAAEIALWRYHQEHGNTLAAIDSLEDLLRLGLAADAEKALGARLHDALDASREGLMTALESQYNLADTWPRAVKTFQEVRDLAVEAGHRRDAFLAQVHLGRCLTESGKPEAGVTAFSAALRSLAGSAETQVGDILFLYRSLADVQAYWTTDLRAFVVYFNSAMAQFQKKRSEAVQAALAKARQEKKKPALVVALTQAADDIAAKSQEKALKLDQEALAVAEGLKRSDIQITLLQRIAGRERRLQQTEAANADLERALGLALWQDPRPLSESDPNHERVPTAVRLRVGDPEVVLPLVRELAFGYLAAGSPLSGIDFVRLSLQQDPSEWGRVRTLQSFASALDAAGYREPAVTFLTQLLDEPRVQTVPRMRAAVLESLAGVRAKTGGLGQDFALESLEKAYLMLKPRGLSNDDLPLLIALGNLRLRKGKVAEAVAVFEEAIDLSERFRAGLASESARLAFLEKDPTQFANYHLAVGGLLRAAAKQPSYLARAFAASEKARARVLLEALGGADLGGSGPLHDEETAVVQRLSLLAEKGLHEGLTLAEQIQYSALQDRLGQISGELRAQDPRYAQLRYPQPAGLEELQQALRPGEALVSYKFAGGDNGAWAFLVPSTGPARLMNLDELAAGADLPPAPEDGAKGGDGSRFRRMGALLWQPVEAELLRQGVKKVFVVPDGGLWRVPFAALETSSGPVIERDYTLQFVPSASVLVELRQEKRARTRAAGELVVFAPFTDKIPPGYEKLVKARKADPIFPESIEVIDRVRGLYPQAAVYLPPNATKENALGATGNYRRALFYTHGVADESSPWFSLIMFRAADGHEVPLTVTEAMRSLRLDHTDLVVLSACQTARGLLTRGEGVMGLTRGLFYAGALGVVSTNWSVPERPTRDLVGDLFENLKKGYDTAKALQLAQRSVRKRAYGKLKGELPGMWAGFALYGDPD